MEKLRLEFGLYWQSVCLAYMKLWIQFPGLNKASMVANNYNHTFGAKVDPISNLCDNMQTIKIHKFNNSDLMQII